MSFQPPQQPGQPEYGAPPPEPPTGPPTGPPPGYAPPPQQYSPPPPPGYAPPPQQYSPPPPAGYPPPPAPGYGAPPPAGYAPGYHQPAPSRGLSFDPSSVNPMDWAILGLAFLTFIFSFIDYYTVSVSFSGISESESASAWHGFFGWAAVLLALAGAALVALELFVPQVTLPFPARLVSLGCWTVATLFVILALFIFPGGNYDGPGLDEGRGFGYWVSLVFIIAGLVLSVLRLKSTGGKLPWEKGPAAPGYGPPVPPPGGYPQQ
jgi:hypothetical protein